MTERWTGESHEEGHPRETLTEVLTPLVLVGLAFGCFLLDQLLIFVGWSLDQPVPGLLAGAILGIGLPVWAACRWLELRPREAVGLERLEWREAAWVVWGVGSVLAPVYASAALAARVFPPSPEAFEFFDALVSRGPGTLVFGGIAVVVLGPLGEEIVFRWLLLGALVRLVPAGAAIALAAVLFAASHGSAWMFAPISLLGALLGLLVWRTGKLSTAWAGHALFNLVAYVDLCVTRDARATRLERWALDPWILGTSLFSLGIVGWTFFRSRPRRAGPDRRGAGESHEGGR